MSPAKDKAGEENETARGEEDYADAVTRHAKYLGIDPERDAAYVWIAEEALNADVPEGWVTGEGEGEYEGLVYYYNEASGRSTWDHPLDDFYREKFRKKKAKHAERKKRYGGDKHASKSRSSLSPSRGSRGTNRRHTSDNDKYIDDLSNSKRKSSKHSTRREKYRSSERVDRSEYDSQGSRHRSASHNRHRKERQTTGDNVEDSRHRSRRGRHGRDDDSRTGADEHESLRRHRSTSDRGTSESDGDTARGPNEEHEDRRQEGRRRSTAHVRDNKSARKQRQSPSTDELLVSGGREKGSKSKPSASSRHGETLVRSSRASNDFTGGVDSGTPVPLDGGGKRGKGKPKARDQPGVDIVARQSLDREGRTQNSRLSETSFSGQEDVGLSPSNRPDFRERRGSQSRGKEHSAGNGAFQTRESFDADRTGRRGDSGEQALSQNQEKNDPRSTDMVTLSQDPLPAAGDTWRAKSVNGNWSGERADSLKARRTTSKEPDFDTGTNARGDWTLGGASGVGNDEQGHILADKAAAPTRKTIELEETVGKEVSRDNPAVPGRGMPGVGQDSDDTREKRMTGTLGNNNDLEEMDFGDELRDIEDESDKNSLPDEKAETSELTTPKKSAADPSSKQPKDVELSNIVATASFASRKSAAPADANAQGQRRPYREECPGKPSPRKGDNHARELIASNRDIEQETQARHRHSHEDDRQGERVGSNISALATSAFGISDRNQDEWPEVTEHHLGGLKGGEKRADSGRESSETMRSDRGGPRRRKYENRIGADEVSRGNAWRHALHGDSSDHKRGVDEKNRSRDRRAYGNSGQPTFHLEGQKGSDRPSAMAPANRGREGAYDVRLDESATKVRVDGGHGTPGISGSLSGDESPFTFRDGKGREHGNYDSRRGGYGSYNDHQQRGWNGGGATTVGYRAGSNDVHQYPAGAGVDHWNVERQLLQQQQEASTKTRELETKLVRLEAGLASSTSREDHLREELADAARREGAAREKHARALAEEEKKVASLNDKVSDAASKAKEAAEADDMRSKSEEGLRLELKRIQEKLKTAEGVLARKEEEEKASAREESDTPSLRLVLATREEEAERQGKVLVDVQGRLAEATNKVTELSREIRRTREVAERVRLEATESSSRASTSEAALSQAASEMSALNHALTRAREEVSSQESEAVKTAEETNRLRLQLGLEREKSSNTEDRLLRAKAAVEGEAESLRARTVELQSANASMEREMRNSQQDSLSRLRESERERDAALYEGKRSAELASSAETWRLKETLRADAAENRALTTGTEVAELRAEAARLRTSTDAVVAPYAKRNAELQEQLDEARREAAGLTAEANRLKDVYAAEMAALKEEVSRKLPSIAERAASEAGRYWRKRAEQETATLRAERDSRLRELQVAISEGEARRQKDVAGARFEAERFRSVAEKLAAENRNIRGELERYLASDASRSAAGLRSSVKSGYAVGSTAGSSSQTFGTCGDTGRGGGQREAANAKTWEGALQAQVLGDVEAHLNVLRAQLKQGTPGIISTVDDIPFERFAGAVHLSPIGAPQRPGDPLPGAAGKLAPTGAVADVEDALASATMGSAPPSMESRGNFHVSPTPEQRSDNGLTEMEGMRLTRLLRSSASSSSPPSVLAPSESIAPMIGHWRIKGNKESSSIVPPGVVNRDIDGGNLRTGNSDRSTSVMPDGDGETEDHYFSEGILSSGNGGVARELFGGGPEEDNEGFGGEGQARRLGEARARGGYVATRGVGSLAGEDGDDLEDISDGGFHSGCWRRKYVRGDMR